MYYLQHEGRVVLDIQTRAEGERLYIRYNTDANVLVIYTNGYERSYSSKILEIRNDFRWENRTKRLCKSAEFCISYTTFVMALISFGFSFMND